MVNNFINSLKKLGWKRVFIMLALVLFEILILFFVIPSFGAEAAQNDPIIQQIYEVFEKEGSRWLVRMGYLLWWTFVTLLSISFFLQLYKLGLSDNMNLGSILHLLVKICLFGLFYKLIFNVFFKTAYGDEVNLLTLIPDTFVWLAEKVTGYKANVFQLMDVAKDMIKALFGIASEFGILDRLFAFFPILLLNIIFYMIAGQMIMAKIEVIMITLAGFSLLVFDGLMDIFDYGKKYLNALIACGFKLFMLSIICGMIQLYATQIPLYFSEAFGGFWYGSAISLSVVTVLYMIAKNVPTMVSAVLSGSAASPDKGFYSSLGEGVTKTVAAAMAGYGMAQAGVQAAKTVGNAAHNYFGQSPEFYHPKMSAADEPPVGYDDGSKG